VFPLDRLDCRAKNFHRARSFVVKRFENSLSWALRVKHKQENKGFGNVAWFLRVHKDVRRFGSEVFMKDAKNKSEYDLNSAITFLMVGLGIGSVLALVFNPKQREEIDRGRRSEFRPRREEERVA
jgi:hypothetical protein